MGINKRVKASCLSVTTFVLVTIVLASVLNGWATSILWSWFVVPLFHAPPLSIAQAIGLTLVVFTIRGVRQDNKDGGDPVFRLTTAFLLAILQPLVVLGAGWVVLQFV